MRLIKYPKILLLLTGLATILRCNAQNAAAPTGDIPPLSYTHFIYLSFATALILSIAIAILSLVWVRLSMYLSEKRQKTIKSILMMTVLAASGHTLSAQSAIPTTQPSASGSHTLEIIFIFCVILIEAFVIFQILIRIWFLIDDIYPRVKPESILQSGIKELDALLPPFWRYGFFISIFLITGFSIYSYASDEIKKDKIQKEELARLKALTVDEYTVTMADATGIDDGKIIFAANCGICHGEKGQGTVGPNLTDSYWLHGGSIGDIFKSVKYGWPAKAMKSWEADLTPVQMRNVVSYIMSIHDTHPPDPKVPQGSLYSTVAPVR
jgi:mono/diheme cytochrome c family protein